MIKECLLTLFFVGCSLFQTDLQSTEPAKSRGKNGSVAATPTTALDEPARRPAPPVVEGGKSDEVKLAVDLVLLDALVLHQKTGSAVGNLKQDNFVLLEDGVKQQITHFGQDSLPLSVIFLIDRGGCLDPF